MYKRTSKTYNAVHSTDTIVVVMCGLQEWSVFFPAQGTLYFERDKLPFWKKCTDDRVD